MSARRLMRWLAALLLAPALLAAGSASASFSFTTTSSPTFYTDTSVSPNLVCNYQSFNITSTTAVADAWAKIGNFGGGFLALGGSDDGLQHLGAFTAGQTRSAFFYVCSSYAVVGGTQAGQTYDVSVYDRNPTFAGAVQLGISSFGVTIDNSLIQAATNQVSVIFAGPNPSVATPAPSATPPGPTGRSRSRRRPTPTGAPMPTSSSGPT